MRSLEGTRISTWYKRADRTLAKLSTNNTVVFIAKRKRIPAQQVIVARYDLSHATRDPELRTRVVTSCGRTINGARPVGGSIDGIWEIPFIFNNPYVVTGALGLLWSLRISFNGQSPLVGVEYTTARGYSCSDAFRFRLDADYKLTTHTVTRMLECAGWPVSDLDPSRYAITTKIRHIPNIDDIPAILVSGDRSVASVIRTLREQLNVQIQHEFFCPITAEAVLELPNN